MAFTSDVFGDRPKVAIFKPINYGQEQTKAIGENISAFPQISQLGDLYKSYLTDQMNQLIPGYSSILAQGGKDTSLELSQAESLLKGEIPQDVQDQVLRNDAYGSLMGGFAGSGMSRNLTARDLGLTSLGLMQQGANLAAQGGSAAQRWAGLASADVMNPATFFVNPQQQANFDLQNRVLHQQSLQNRYNVAAAPDPTAKGVSDTIINLIGAYLGAGKGGGGGVAAQGTTPYASTNYNYSMDQGDPYGYANYGSLGLGPGGA